MTQNKKYTVKNGYFRIDCGTCFVSFDNGYSNYFKAFKTVKANREFIEEIFTQGAGK